MKINVQNASSFYPIVNQEFTFKDQINYILSFGSKVYLRNKTQLHLQSVTFSDAPRVLSLPNTIALTIAKVVAHALFIFPLIATLVRFVARRCSSIQATHVTQGANKRRTESSGSDKSSGSDESYDGLPGPTAATAAAESKSSSLPDSTSPTTPPPTGAGAGAGALGISDCDAKSDSDSE